MIIDLREKIIQAFLEALAIRELALRKELTDDVVLLETGLDSLGFAILVAKLEEYLAYDPFVLMDEPYYPKTLGEFVSIYDQYKDHAVS